MVVKMFHMVHWMFDSNMLAVDSIPSMDYWQQQFSNIDEYGPGNLCHVVVIDKYLDHIDNDFRIENFPHQMFD